MTIAEESHRDHVMSPVDVLRLILAALLIFLGLIIVNLVDSALLGLSDDGTSALKHLPVWLRDLPATVMAVALLAAVSSTVGWALLTRRFRRLLLLVLAFLGAAALSVLFGEFISRIIDGPVRAAFDSDATIFRYRDSDGSIHPGDPLLAGGIAMLTIGSSYLRHAVNRGLAALLGLYAVLSLLTAGVPAVGLPTDIGSGILVGSVLLLAAGRHDMAPNEPEIRASLASIGVVATSIAPMSVDARGSTPWAAQTVDAQTIFTKVLGRDERSADLMFRAYRWIRLRKTGDHRPFVSLRRAVEHEALVALQARSLGVHTPLVVGVAEAGVDGMLLAYESVPGKSADRLETLDDDVLDNVWMMVNDLHAKRIAHRDLRLANIMVGDDGDAWLIDFGFAELAASDQLLGTDVAELLASTAAVVGPERAVEAAHRMTGLEELERAMPWLQPLALSGATRSAIGGEKGLEPIRQLLLETCGVPAEEPIRLQRIDAKSMFLLATLALTVYFLVPQLADVDNIWRQIRGGSVSWMVAAVGFSLITYVAATASLLGAIPCRLRFFPALAAQLASSFANRVTPAKVGGVATNLRYFQRHGVPTAVGATAVGLNAVAGLTVHIGLTTGFLILASGSDTSSGLAVPSPLVLLYGALGVAALAGLTLAIAPLRRLVVAHVVPQIRASFHSMKTVGRSPARLALLMGGSAVITLGYLGAMIASLQAFDSSASLPVVGLLFLTASAVASAAPTPGGLGAAEAAFIAAFSAVEDAQIVVPAVFLYRFVTFWLPILPGWFALTWLRRTDNI